MEKTVYYGERFYNVRGIKYWVWAAFQLWKRVFWLSAAKYSCFSWFFLSFLSFSVRILRKQKFFMSSVGNPLWFVLTIYLGFLRTGSRLACVYWRYGCTLALPNPATRISWSYDKKISGRHYHPRSLHFFFLVSPCT